MSSKKRQENTLREEIACLGEMLGETIQDIAGEDALNLVEKLRRLAWDRRNGKQEAGTTLTQLIASLDNDQLRVVIRAFSLFLDLTNLAEDRQRVYVLRERKRDAYPNAHSESISQAIEDLRHSGKSSNDMQQLLDQLHIELVFTAHPTEAKRRSVRSKLREIRKLLSDLDLDQLPGERNRTLRHIRAELTKIWSTLR